MTSRIPPSGSSAAPASHAASRIAAPNPDQTASVDLRILATTDLHMNLLAWDYERNQPRHGRSLESLIAPIAMARAEAANSLLLDNGDFLQGTALGDRVALDHAEGKRAAHPMIMAMTALGYDAANLGNHDFSYGVPFLLHVLEQAKFPIVSTNILSTTARNLFAQGSTARNLTLPWVILDKTVQDRAGKRHVLRVGLLGFAPPQTMLWEAHHLTGKIEIEDIVQSARRAIPRLKAEGADVIIALSHSGIGPAEVEDGMENAAIPLAALQGIDAMIVGHTHQVFPSASFAGQRGADIAEGTLAGTPAVMPGAYGSHLGVIDLVLRRDAAGWTVQGHKSECRKALAEQQAAPEARLVAAPVIAAAHQETLEWGRQRLGRIDRAMSTHFALVTPVPPLQLLAQAQARYVAAALRNGPHGRLPVLSAVAPFRAGGRSGPDNYATIEAGEFQLRHVMTLYPHPNTLTALRLSGAELLDWMERAVSIFRQIVPGQADQPLIDPDFPAFNFDMIDGLDCRIDLSQPARFDPRGHLVRPDAQRIIDLTWRGDPVRPNAAFILATNSYRSNGGQGFAGAEPANVVLDDGLPVREVLVRYIAERGANLPPAPAGWHFAAMPDTSVLFDTAPEAQFQTHLFPDLALEPLYETEDGFLRFRLTL